MTLKIKENNYTVEKRIDAETISSIEKELLSQGYLDSKRNIVKVFKYMLSSFLEEVKENIDTHISETLFHDGHHLNLEKNNSNEGILAKKDTEEILRFENFEISLMPYVDILSKNDCFHYVDELIGSIIFRKNGIATALNIFSQGEVEIIDQNGKSVTNGINYFNQYDSKEFDTDEKLKEKFYKGEIEWIMNNWLYFEIIEENGVVYDSGSFDVRYEVDEAIEKGKEIMIAYLKGEL